MDAVDLVRGNPTEVKVVLAGMATAPAERREQQQDQRKESGES